MFVFPRPLIRNSLLILITLAVLFCIKDSLFEMLTGISALTEGNDFNNHESTSQPPTTRNTTKRELMLIQMLFRHGHRAPFMLYPYDPNSEDFWKEGMGMLTQLGRLQHYAMGVHLQQRYKDFITTNPKEIEMINSNNFRCQYGVYCFIAGMYEPTKEFSFTDEIKWQPIISRQAEYKGKSVLTRGKCKISDEDSYALKRSVEANRTKEKYHDLYNFWSRNSGRLIDSWVLASDLGKTLACEKEYNLTIPEWGLQYWDEFSMQTGISYYFNYGTKLIQKYRIGPLLGYMLEQIQDKILHRIPEKKVYIYSAHGSNIACLLLALDQYNWKGPPYASTIILELWKEDDQDYSIRWLYYNSTHPERRIDPPVPLVLEGCGGEFCPLGQYENLIRRLIPEDWKEECNDTSQKFKFLPFESPVHVPGLSSAEKFSIQWTAIIFLLLCVLLLQNNK
ncbi:unnamed protein product [Larinioides sclopetarius]|uniref:acid phosphatase n=1 Tax=Larinioides sclopetarius TaxID=280406 RepID=A0AAV2B5Q4_9ARAC